MAKEPNLGGLSFEQLQEVFALGVTMEHVKELTASGFGFDQIRQLAPTIAASRQGSNGLTAAQLKELLDGQRKALNPSNAQHPGISVFSHPEGELAHPKDKLRRETFFNHMRQRDDCLTPNEIDLFNRFESSKTARNGMWTAKVTQDGTTQELHIVTQPQTYDADWRNIPLTQILRELLDGAQAADPEALAQRVAELERQLKERQLTGAAA